MLQQLMMTAGCCMYVLAFLSCVVIIIINGGPAAIRTRKHGVCAGAMMSNGTGAVVHRCFCCRLQVEPPEARLYRLNSMPNLRWLWLVRLAACLVVAAAAK